MKAPPGFYNMSTQTLSEHNNLDGCVTASEYIHRIIHQEYKSMESDIMDMYWTQLLKNSNPAQKQVLFNKVRYSQQSLNSKHCLGLCLCTVMYQQFE